jgi:hypothetical protein
VSLTSFGNLFLNFNFLGLVFSVTLSPLYFFAILGTFQYHAFRKDVERGKL